MNNTSRYIANPSRFEIRKGVNLSHWLSQTQEWAQKDKFITKDDIQLIAEFGFDHIRLPVDEEVLWEENGQINKKNLGYVQSCLKWCADAKLRVVFDLHILRSHHFNARMNEGAMTLWTDPSAQQTFIHLWENLSEHLKEYPNDFLAYELMNEPVAPEHEQWNQLINRAIQAVRKREPLRVVCMGSNRWQKPFTFPFLKVPAGDANIILSCHTYHPYFVTHHKAPWSAARFYTGPVQYPGQCITDADFEKYVDKNNPTLMARLQEEKGRDVYNKQKLQAIVQDAINKSRELNLQLYCNEFGCLPTVSRQMRLNYYNDITDIFRENSMSWASWDYKGDFSIVKWDKTNLKNGEIDHELIKILTR